MVHEGLVWSTSLLASLHEHAGTHGIAQVLLAGVVLYHGTSAHYGMVGGVVLLVVVGVPCMCIVGAHHEGVLHAHGKVLEVRSAGLALPCHQPLHQRCKEGRTGTLLRLASRLLVVEDGQALCHLGSISVGQQSLHAGMRHAQVVQASALYQFSVQAHALGRSGVVQI